MRLPKWCVRLREIHSHAYRMRMGTSDTGAAAEVGTLSREHADLWHLRCLGLHRKWRSLTRFVKLHLQKKTALSWSTNLQSPTSYFLLDYWKPTATYCFLQSPKKKNKDKSFHRGNNSLPFPRASSALLPVKLKQHFTYIGLPMSSPLNELKGSQESPPTERKKEKKGTRLTEPVGDKETFNHFLFLWDAVPVSRHAGGPSSNPEKWWRATKNKMQNLHVLKMKQSFLFGFSLD